jgi:glycerophosphoryl diester phosphodiesterase
MCTYTRLRRKNRTLARSWPFALLLIGTAAQGATLVGYAELLADTFSPGPTAGQSIEAANGREPPFVDQQPVQGFSALVRYGEQRYLALSDNGFGAKANSADYLLCIYEIEPDFRTAEGGSGEIRLRGLYRLRDTDQHLGDVVEDPALRLLTGADFDPESFRRTPDGNIWVGEEFYPALLKFDPRGKLLAPPYTLHGLVSPDNPAGATATLPRSRGFEGMAQSPDGRWLYPMLEGALNGAPAGLNIYTFDTGTGIFTNANALEPSYRYRLDENATAIGDFTLYSDTAGLVIERDSEQGEAAALKKVYKIDFGHVDDDGFLVKTLVADLMDIDDPHDLNRDGKTTFDFPFWTIEGLSVIDATTIVVVNDNNYPFGAGRGTGPENTEMILLEIPPLW